MFDEALADLSKGAPVLDAGCGAGLPISARMAQRFAVSEVDIDGDWIGAGAPMYWLHYDRETNVKLVREAGFAVDRQRLIVEDEGFGGTRHPLIRAHRV